MKMTSQAAVLSLVMSLLWIVPLPCFTQEQGEIQTEESRHVHNQSFFSQDLQEAEEPTKADTDDDIQNQKSTEPAERRGIIDGQHVIIDINSPGSVEAVHTEDDTQESKVIQDGRYSETKSDTVPRESSAVQDNRPHVVKPVLLKMEAFGVGGMEEEEKEEERVMADPESQGQRRLAEEEVWTEHTDDGADQKHTAVRRFFSLMNLIKFLLNPVIEEFEEMEKTSTQMDDVSSSTTNTPVIASVRNDSELGTDLPGNSSELLDKDTKKNTTDSGKKTRFHCIGRNVTENNTALVRIVNSTRLLELLSFDKNHTTSDCVLVMFYAPWCRFCADTAPHYNAMARAFSQLEVVAVDTVHFSNLNARFGTVAVPNIMLFHQSRSAVRFNHTERHFQTLLQFVTNTTGLEPNTSVDLAEEDYLGPLSSVPTEETDYLLWFSWLFIVVCSGYIFISSQPGQRAIERLNVLWQEHQHID